MPTSHISCFAKPQVLLKSYSQCCWIQSFRHTFSVVKSVLNPCCSWNPQTCWNHCFPSGNQTGQRIKIHHIYRWFPMKTFIECGVNILWLHYAWLQHPPRWHHLRMRQQELQHFYSTPQGGHVQRRLTVLSTKRHVDPVGQGTSEDLGKIYHLVI